MQLLFVQNLFLIVIIYLFFLGLALRKDFEIDYRFKDLSLKLQIIKDDTQFFLEVLHNKKSTRIELIIVLLIAGEMLIGIAGLGIQYLG